MVTYSKIRNCWLPMKKKYIAHKKTKIKDAKKELCSTKKLYLSKKL